MNQTQTRSLRKKVLSLILAVVMAVSLLPISAFASGNSTSTTATTSDEYEYNIMFLDCGRKYYSVDSIKQIIDNASAAGFNYIQLAVGNDGLRFLLDDMSLTVNGTTYESSAVKSAIQKGNAAYNATFNKNTTYNPETNELTQSEMDTIIAYAASKGMGVIPCVNTPGHMDAILSAATSLTGKDCAYSGSARTIDVTNTTAVAFTQALLQKYITYFADKGCQLFNMGADEYANDIYTGGSMGFGNLQDTNKYSYYVNYVNAVDDMIQAAGMTAMAFNDGIYFNSNTSSGTFNTDIIVCYWSNGWGDYYTPMPASDLAGKGFKLINTHGDYYWVLGKSDWQCSKTKASGFNYKQFQGSTISTPAGSMFCIWADYPGAETEASVISKTADTIAAFGKALPQVKKVETVESKTVTKNNVTVTAPGLTNLTVAAADAPTIDAAAKGKVVAYDVTPATASGSYKKTGTVTLPIPEGWDASRVRGFVKNEDGSITTVSGTTANGKFTFTVPHFSVLGIYELAANAVDKTENVTVVQGSESEAYLLSGNVTLADGTYTTDDGVASYTIKTTTVTTPSSATAADSIVSGNEYIIGNGEQWLALSSSSGITSVANKDQATKWTIEGNKTAGYTIKNGSSYLGYTSSGYNRSLTVSSKSTSWQWDGNGFNVKLYNYYSYYISYSSYGYNSGWTLSYNSGDANPYVLTPEKTTTTKTVVFTGLKAGETTSVIIGNVKYNIIVSDKAPDDALTATSIDLEYWITNELVHETNDKTTENVQKITTSKDGVTSAEGIAIADVAPETAYAFYDGTVIVHYWQAVRLDADHQQTDKSGVDQTAAGTTLTHIRYHGGAWQYKTTDGAWHYFQSDDQLVAYYLKETEVTKEVKTSVKDWGYGTDSETPNTSSGKGQVALTVAVVYPDGTVSPAEGSMYASSTTIFNYWDGRDIGIVAPTNNSDYNISKITVTDGTRDSNDDDENVWYPYDSISWNKKTNVAGKEWYDETEVWNKSSGTTPMVNGKTRNITWSAKNTAKLVLIYLEPIEKETNLNVQYIDLNANNYVFHSYQVAMKYQSDDVPTFTKALMQGNTVIGGKGPWNSNVVGNTNYLPDEAYVTNSSNTKQTFRKDITTIPEINGIYASGLYKYMKADISEDGKTLRLYYDLSATGGKTFVVDFGLPVEIPFDDFEITNASNVTVSFDATDTKKTERTGNYGVGKINMAAQTVTYTLYKTLDAKTPIPVYVSDGTNTVMQSVNIIPATSVYYEDSFATFTNADSTKNVAQVDNAAKGIWTKVTDGTTQTNVNQALEELGGTTNTKNVYGYDQAYANSSKFSMGSATKVTVAADTYKEGKTQWPTATFTFKGTGFDVISLTDNTSGAIYVYVYEGAEATGEPVRRYVVNNYYGYTRDSEGKWVVDKNASNNALYQIPVMKITDLDYGQYTAVIKVGYSAFQDVADNGYYNFWLDAIRVYNPMGTGADANANYVKDNEGYPQYIKLHDSLLSGSATPNENLLFVDGADNAAIEQYTSYGPNNEVYLMNGQAISFRLKGDLSSIASVQIGAKSPNGTDAVAKISVNDQEVKTATEMYYAITDEAKSGELVTIANDGAGILSLTNLKITYTESGKSVSLAPLTTADQENAVAQVRALFAVPVEPFNPDPFTASWGHSVRKGDTATLTVKASEDTAYVKVDGNMVADGVLRTERTGWGWWAKTVTYREFTYTDTATVTKDYTVCAVNGKGVSSDAITATLTVRPSVRDWLHGIIGKWF